MYALGVVCQGSAGAIQDTAFLMLAATLPLAQVFLLYALSQNMPHKWKLRESVLATKVTIPCFLFCHWLNCEILNFGSSVAEASVLLELHSVEMLEPNCTVMWCHIAGKWEPWFRDPFFAVSADAVSCWIRVIASPLIGGVFKKSCQNVCDVLVWICGLRKGPSNFNCTHSTAHINLVMLCDNSLWINLGFPCHSESWYILWHGTKC